MKIITNNISLNHFKQGINKQISKTIYRRTEVKNKIPLVSVPIIMYMSLKSIRDVNNTNNCREAINEQKQLLREHKISQQEYNSRVKEIKDYYKEAHNLPDDVSSYKIKSKEPHFRGSETQNSEELPDYMMSSEVDTEVATSDRINIHNLVDNPSLQKHMTIKDIERMDTSMCPELEEYMSKPVEEVPDGLMSNILDDLPEGFEVSDEGLFNTLKGYMQQLTEWLGE